MKNDALYLSKSAGPGCNAYIVFFSALFLILSASSCTSQREQVYRKSTILMDTVVTVTVVSSSGKDAELAIEESFSIIKTLQQLTDFYSPDSEVSSVNRNAGISAVSISEDTLDAVMIAHRVSEDTLGGFDITIGAVSAAYDFTNPRKPDPQMLASLLPLVNYRNIVINMNDSTVFLAKKGMRIDLGGIMKGYAADKAVDVLKRRGIRAGLVSVAGDIRSFGHKPDGKPWKVGIRNPNAKRNKDEIMTTLELTDMAISTSGDYERFFEIEGQRVHHLISPFTGVPVKECRSVSVIGPQGAITDSLATGVFVLGPAKGLALLNKMGFEGIIVDIHGNVHGTNHLRQ
jgi:thiamine biosynthesis lipoprotein